MRVRLCLILCSVLLTLPAFAQQDNGQQLRFRWTDAVGQIHLADALPADASQYGYDLINQYGTVIRHVDGMKTPEQLAKAKTKAEAAEHARKQERDDRRLLLAYPTEEDLVATQTDQRQLLENTIASTQENMKSQLNSLATLLDQAAAYTQRGEKVPADVQERVNTQRDVVRKQRNWVDQKKAELAAFATHAAAQLQHYRNLRNR